MQVFPQVLQDGLRGRGIAHFVNGAAVKESDRCGHCCLGFNPACEINTVAGRSYKNLLILNISNFA
jgi:hypothetical protein